MVQGQLKEAPSTVPAPSATGLVATLYHTDFLGQRFTGKILLISIPTAPTSVAPVQVGLAIDDFSRIVMLTFGNITEMKIHWHQQWLA